MDERREKVHDICMDRISNLPRNLIDCILERMTFRNAARTSILSRNWRYIWAGHPQLVLDKQFFEEVTKNQQFRQYTFEKIVNKILLVHTGPILKFVLYIPNIHFNGCPDIDQWILVLARNGIKKLTIENSNRNPFRLPSHIFSCFELTYMSICNCILKPPLEFGGFSNIIILDLAKISFSANILGTLLPSAQRLSFRNCTGMEYLKIHAPKLNGLIVVNSHNFDWQCFKSNKNLTMVYIALCKKVDNPEQGRTVNLINFLGYVPNIRKLWLDGFSFKFLAADTIPKTLPTSINHLICLRLFDFGFSDFDQISCALCLLRSSPNLQNLEIGSFAITHDAMELGLNYLEAYKSLNRLKMVKLMFIKGRKAELLFIEFILAHSPSLERMIIELSRKINANEELRISRELIRFSRASPMAEIVYLRPGNS